MKDEIDIALNEYRISSTTKKTTFFLLSLFSGIWGLIFLTSGFKILPLLLLGVFLFAGLFWSLFMGRKIFLFLLPVPLYFSGIFFSFSSSENFGLLLFALGSLISFLSFLQNYQEKISLSFFRDGFRSLKSGMIWMILGIFLLFFGNFLNFSPNENFSQKILDSEYYAEFLQKISQNEEVKNTSSQVLAQKISEACQGNTVCIKEETKKAISEFDANITESVKNSFNPLVEKFTNPEVLKTIVQEKNIPYLSEFSGEILLKIFLFVILFFATLPLVPIFSLLFAIFFSFLMFFMMAIGGIIFGKKSVQKDIIY